MIYRKLGRSNIEVSALGLGCWAIGGPFWKGEQPVGWGEVDDDESVRAIHAALDMGVTLIDTANVYGCGHSERVVGRAIADRRDKVVIATKFGRFFDEEAKQITGEDCGPDDVKPQCEESLRRLGVDRIDLYQYHLGRADNGEAIREALEKLCDEGKIRFYGWSTDDVERARVFAQGEHCAAIQQNLNVFIGNYETLDLCEKQDLASLNRSPLGRGLLTGKFDENTTFADDDVRANWGSMKEGQQADQLKKLEAVRDILTSDGRSLTQGALAWIWGKSEATLPIPGFRNVEQVTENAKSADFGPLTADQMRAIDRVLGREG